jgi:hypothetical protein
MSAISTRETLIARFVIEMVLCGNDGRYIAGTLRTALTKDERRELRAIVQKWARAAAAAALALGQARRLMMIAGIALRARLRLDRERVAWARAPVSAGATRGPGARVASATQTAARSISAWRSAAASPAARACRRPRALACSDAAPRVSSSSS